MEWIQENYTEIFAILFGLYSVARMVVALTPTKKDDAYVTAAGIWLEKIAKLFGLDMTQGRKKE